MLHNVNVRPELPPMPDRIRGLLVDERGYPVPWFVEWIEGKPDFRVMDGRKLRDAIKKSLCWICGQPLGRWKVFVIGPMCAINRTSAEPPSHRDCAEFSARACPFLTRPHMVRRDNDVPAEAERPAGEMITRNPGVTLLWITQSYTVHRAWAGQPGILLTIGPPEQVICYAEGRLATVDEIRQSIQTGVPLLQAEAERQGLEAVRVLKQQTVEAMTLLGV